MAASILDQPYCERDDRPHGRLDDALVRGWAVASRRMAPLRRRRLNRLAVAVERQGPGVLDLSDARLLDAARGLRARLLRPGLTSPGLTSQGLTRETATRAFALAREACARQIGLRHYREQIIGGAAMLDRCVAEMATGEGKTITAVLPAAAFALAGRPVHVVTVNDYLAERDAAQLRPVYEALGLTVGLVVEGQDAAERRAAYAADVTYCTNKTLVFDYLRDRLALGRSRGRPRQLIRALTECAAGPGEGLLLRGLHVAIIDEADQVLIDEARTPLILAGAGAAADSLHAEALDQARELEEGAHWRINQRERGVSLTPAGRDALARRSGGQGGLWNARRAREELAERALAALHLFHRDAHYIVADGKVQIVDEATGRVMPDRSWEFGLHQMIEAKEEVAITGGKTTLARMTFQRFFRRYRHLSGMTGTVMDVAGEIAGSYGLATLTVPTHRPSRRRAGGALLFAGADAKWAAIVASTRASLAEGRAVLIGTRSVETSDHMGACLSLAGLAHTILNARQDRQEAAIVAAAGQAARITVATNMAGRGTDIRLSQAVRAAGGLHVILTEYHESRRVDRQLFGRGGRQGDPGTYQCFAALDDELFIRFIPARLRRFAGHCALGEARLVPGLIARFLLRHAQRTAKRLNARIRHETLLNDQALDRVLAFAGPRE